MGYRTLAATLSGVAILTLSVSAAYVVWSKGGNGSGLYSRLWSPDSVQGYWDPDPLPPLLQTT
ncbi:MAG: hypothetical protein DBP01_04250 [gamma proteobacterium symbiont of Ctena orbiculata]|nr:MAG: hypothetical protein DBP01_04250 [gamma proteobacterium symbiont of Ctena orbiculata]